MPQSVQQLIRLRSKLEEVTSELSNLKEVIRSNSAPFHTNYSGGSNSQNSQNSLSPEGSMLTVPPIVTRTRASSFEVPSFSFYGIENSRVSAFAIGEQRLGDIQLSGMAFVELFEQY